VILDKVPPQRDERVAERIQATGARVIYLPPYSPHLNPIAMAWSKIKHVLRKAAARTVETLYQAWAEALQSISPTDAKGFFQHVGFCV
jgi:transposase